MYMIQWIIAFAIYLNSANSQLFNQPEQVTTDLLDCAIKVSLETNFSNLVIQTVENNALEYILKHVGPAVIINSDIIGVIKTTRYKFNSNIIIIKNEEEYKRYVDVFYRTLSWNARAKFLIIFTGNVNLTSVLEFTWKLYILNIVILLKEDSKIQFYTYFPYGDTQCGNVSPKLIGSCTDNIPAKHFYLPKVPLNLHGCIIKLIAFYYQPYVINPYSNVNPGLEIVMIKEFGKAINFTPIYVDHKLKYLGYKYGKGVYSQMLNMLYNFEGNMLLGSIKLNTTFDEEFDSTDPHLKDSVCWYAPIAQKVAPWKNLIIVFEDYVWLILCCLICFTAVFWKMISHVLDQCYYNQILKCVTNVWYSLLLGSIRQPTGFTMRLSFAIWVLGTFLISTIYQTMFTSILTNPVYGKQISNMKEMLESGLDYGFDSLAEGEFNFPHDKVLWTIHNNYIPCPLHQAVYCIKRTVVTKNFVLAKNRKNMAYFLKKNYQYLGGNAAVYEFEAYVYYLRIIVNQGFPLLERLNSLISRAHDSGLFIKWNSDLTETLHLKQKDKKNIIKLSVEHLQAAFFMLIMGLAVGVIVFTFELLVYKFKNTCRRYSKYKN